MAVVIGERGMEAGEEARSARRLPCRRVVLNGGTGDERHQTPERTGYFVSMGEIAVSCLHDRARAESFARHVRCHTVDVSEHERIDGWAQTLQNVVAIRRSDSIGAVQSTVAVRLDARNGSYGKHSQDVCALISHAHTIARARRC